MGLGILSTILSPSQGHENTVSDSSDSSSDEEIISESTSEEEVLSKYRSNTNLAEDMSPGLDTGTDAAVNVNEIKNIINTTQVVTIDKILDIQNELEIYEKISLIYLLYDDNVYHAYNVAIQLIEGEKRNTLYEWAQNRESVNTKWQDKFVEALAIIQNFKILKSLGLKKDYVTTVYLPYRHFTSVNINTVKKCIYLICESLNEVEKNRFLDEVKSDFESKNLNFRDFNELELYFLYWEKIKYNQMNDLKNVIRIFKQMDLEEICDNLKKVEVTTNDTRSNQSNNRFDDTLNQNRNNLESLSSSTLNSINSNNSNQLRDQVYGIKEQYFIDQNNPGVCLIVNQENFYTEFDERYKDLLPKINYKLESRKGSTKDREILEKTFNNFGYKVILKENLTHLKMLEEIEIVVKNITNESSLFVCIMSHGDEGIIYGVNSCKVDINTIQDIISKKNKNLNGKPKILILQSCRGQQCQTIPNDSDDDDLETDAPTRRQTVPFTADMLQFWATVPGYGAIRNKKTGSWFIQSLCSKICALSRTCHFEDICTEIVNDVSAKIWQQNKDNVVMVPLKVSTLRKLFFLPVPNN